MIISHKYKFIFFKTRKTAGTSIEISLSRYCGKDDVITPFVDEEDEKIRQKLKIAPQNYLLDKSMKIIFNKLKKNVFKQSYPTPRDRGLRFWHHTPAYYVKKEVSAEIWNSYFKFCFDRNPWDKTVSLYYWDQRKDQLKGLSFSEYLETDTFRKMRHYNYPMYSDENGKLLVDFVGKYENLENDLAKICKQLGIDFDGWMPHAKGSYRKHKKHYSEYFNKEQAKYIQEYFKKEIELLDYKFERSKKE